MERTQMFERWYDKNRDDFIKEFIEDNREIVRTDEDEQDVENNQAFQDWVDELFEEYLVEIAD
jgi:hypothetical protein